MKLLDLSPLALGPAGGARAPGISSRLVDGWVHGERAARNCRLDPQSTCFDVWEELGLDPVHPARGMRHRADLAVAQLRALGGLDPEAEWAVAVPAGWDKDRLRIFLGVAKECGLTVRTLFPRALAVAAYADDAADRRTVWEWGWRALYRARVERGEGGWNLTDLETVADGGVLACFRREARKAATLALEAHRHDPLFSGETEQRLFDGWRAWHGEGAAWVYEHGGVRMEFSSTPEAFRAVHEALRAAVVSDAEAPSLFPRGLAHLLGVKAEVETDDLSPALAGVTPSPGEGARWKESLGGLPPSVAARPTATHVVVDGLAEPAPEGMVARAGETVSLPDGRTALAVHVPSPAP